MSDRAVTATLILSLWALVYLLGAFTTWSWNPRSWEDLGRCVALIIAVVGSVAIWQTEDDRD